MVAMSEPAEKSSSEKRSDLRGAIREVKNDLADRDDVVVEMREAQRTRLELLAQELEPVFADIAEDDDRFDLALSSGVRPRLWIDAVAHVAMGRDRRTYRFLKDTRLGRVVLCESLDLKAVAAQVTRYVAERVVERERALEGDFETSREISADEQGMAAQNENVPAETAEAERPESARSSILKGLGILLLGVAVGVGFVAVLAWDRVSAYLGISF
jgi:hypothetical protein